MAVVSRCLDDSREPGKIKHTLLDLIRQRIYQIALGYEDQNDADALVSLYIRVYPGPRRSIVLYMDGTDDPTHGQQEFIFL